MLLVDGGDERGVTAPEGDRVEVVGEHGGDGGAEAPGSVDAGFLEGGRHGRGAYQSPVTSPSDATGITTASSDRPWMSSPSIKTKDVRADSGISAPKCISTLWPNSKFGGTPLSGSFAKGSVSKVSR